MIGCYFTFLGYILELCLTDLLDKRYRPDIGFGLLPWFNINWQGSEYGNIISVALGWLNLELTLIFFSEDYYYGVLEDEIEKHLNNDSEDEDENNS
jgi:hypothetical protein